MLIDGLIALDITYMFDLVTIIYARMDMRSIAFMDLCSEITCIALA